jgi:hypothetical protein
MGAPPETAVLPDWGQGEQSKGTSNISPGYVAAAVVAATSLVAGLLTGMLLLFVAVAVAGIAAGIWWSSGAAARGLQSLGASPVSEEGSPRLANVVGGLASDLGIEPPSLWTLDEPEANAAVTGGSKPSLAVTAGLLAAYTRTELEAVVAHSLVRIIRSSGSSIPPLGLADDIAAAAVTRYPPALASAVKKASPRGDGGGLRWFVPDGGPAPDVRAHEVLDL